MTKVKKSLRRAGPAVSYILAEYREHVGAGTKCGCNFDGPDYGCDKGYSLYHAAHPRRPTEM